MKGKRSFKYIGILVLSLLIKLPATGQERLREVNLRVNGIGSGSSYTTVIKKFGSPSYRVTEKYDATESCSNMPETHLTLKYPGLEVTLLGDGKGRKMQVYSMKVRSKKWLASGVRLGTDPSDVRKRFGKPVSQAIGDGTLTYYYVTPGNVGGVNFEFKNRKLVRIRMNETLC